jgi:hypothetical protein
MQRQLPVFLLTLLFSFIISACGIPDYPYLYPPDAFEDVRIGFKHDPDNDPNVFEGYEIYYRVYSASSEDTKITSDLAGYFTGTAAFQDISNGDYPDGVFYRRMVVKDVSGNEVGTDPPLLKVSGVNCVQDFDVELVKNTEGYMDIIFYYTAGTYRGYRDGTDLEGDMPFVPITEYEAENSDIAPDINPTDGLKIAFFAVPYGKDEINLNPIFANGTSEDMEYIGILEVLH